MLAGLACGRRMTHRSEKMALPHSGVARLVVMPYCFCSSLQGGTRHNLQMQPQMPSAANSEMEAERAARGLLGLSLSRHHVSVLQRFAAKAASKQCSEQTA
jgi:hypothetical protein